MTGRLPDFLVIGAAKAGTTSLAEWLRAHPDAFIPARKELHFFDQPECDDPERIRLYREHFDGRSEAIVGEASPSYLAHPLAAANMAALVPSARLVAVLRNPVDRAVSHYWYARAIGHDSRDIEEALFGSGGPPRLRYLEEGRYAVHLRRLLEHYPRDAVLVRLFEDLKDEPDQCFEEVCGFLGIAPVRTKVVGRAFNTHYRLRAPWVRRTMIRLHATARWPRLAPRIDRLLMAPATYPPLDEGLRRRLVEWFAEDNAELERWLGRELPGWTHQPGAIGDVAG